MFSLLADLQKERGFPHPSRKKKLLKFKRESTCSAPRIPLMCLWREVHAAQEVLRACGARSVSCPLKRRLRAAPRPACPQSVTLGWSEIRGAAIPGACLAR